MAWRVGADAPGLRRLFCRCRDSLRTSQSLQTSFGRQSEHEARYSVHHRLGAPIATYEHETGAQFTSVKLVGAPLNVATGSIAITLELSR